MERRYLVANKIDLSEDRIVDEEMGRRVKLSSTFLIYSLYFSSLFAIV